MDLILGLSAVGLAFAGLWLLVILALAAILGGLVVAFFGSLFFMTSRVTRRFNTAPDRPPEP